MNNGYIRKIDELGRIVIPKEIRQRMKIQAGENLSINCSDNTISLSKYSDVENNSRFVEMIGDRIHFYTNFEVIIVDLENIVYSSQKFTNLKAPEFIRDYINNRESLLLSNLKINELEITGSICIEPIIVSSSPNGAVIMYTDKEDKNLDKMAKFIASAISIHLDVT